MRSQAHLTVPGTGRAPGRFGAAHRVLQEAIEAPRARLWNGRRVEAEARLPEATVAGLRERGHEVELAKEWTMVVGGIQGIAIDPETKVATGAADPRREGFVAVA